MSINKGSYVIKGLAQRITDNIENSNKYFLYEIYHQLQKYLHDSGKQHTRSTFNDGTEYIKFVKNQNAEMKLFDEFELSAVTNSVKQKKKAKTKSTVRNESETLELTKVSKPDLPDQLCTFSWMNDKDMHDEYD